MFPVPDAQVGPDFYKLRDAKLWIRKFVDNVERGEKSPDWTPEIPDSPGIYAIRWLVQDRLLEGVSVIRIRQAGKALEYKSLTWIDSGVGNNGWLKFNARGAAMYVDGTARFHKLPSFAGDTDD